MADTTGVNADDFPEFHQAHQAWNRLASVRNFEGRHLAEALDVLAARWERQPADATLTFHGAALMLRAVHAAADLPSPDTTDDIRSTTEETPMADHTIDRTDIENRAAVMWQTLIDTSEGPEADAAREIEADPSRKLALLYGVRLAAMAVVEALREQAVTASDQGEEKS